MGEEILKFNTSWPGAKLSIGEEETSREFWQKYFSKIIHAL